MLQGMEKFKVLDEDDSRPTAWRMSTASTSSRPTATTRTKCGWPVGAWRHCSSRSPKGRGSDTKVPASMADEDLVNALAQYLEFEPVEKQALLERDSLLARCRSLIELLEMKVIVAQTQVGRGTLT